MPVKINGTTSGSVTLAAPATGSDVTLTLPGSAGTVATQTYADGLAGLQFIVSAPLSGSSVIINSCFSATYNVYRLVIERMYVAAGVPELGLRLRVSGSDAATNYNKQEALAGGTAWTLARRTSMTSFPVASITTTEASTPVIIDIFNPFASLATGFMGMSNYQGAEANPAFILSGGAHTTATSYDSLTLLPTSSTFSGGTARIYGYRNS